MSVSHRFGIWAEMLASAFMEQCGFTCEARRFRCQAGEIDLVLRRRGLLVFAEVKARGPGAVAAAVEAVDARKRSRLRRVARVYIWKHSPRDVVSYRFDVLALEFQGEGQGVVLRHFVAAF